MKKLALISIGLLLGSCSGKQFGEGFADKWQSGLLSPVWETNIGFIANKQSMQAISNNLCVLNQTGQVYLIDIATGVANPHYSITNAIIDVSGACTSRKIVTVSRTGILRVIDFDDDSQTWQRNINSNVLGAPILSGSSLIILQTNGVISSYALFTGDKLWELEITTSEFRFDGKFKTEIANNILYFGSPEGTLYAIDIIDGFILWEERLFNNRDPDPTANLSIVAGPTHSRGITCGAALNGSTGCVDETGRQLWQKEISSAAVLASTARDVFVISDSGNLLSLNKQNSIENWRYSQASASRSPVVFIHEDYVVYDNGFVGLSLVEINSGEQVGGYELYGELVDYLNLDDGFIVLTNLGQVIRFNIE